MAVWETLAAVLDAFWTWCAEAGDRNIMLQGSAVFFGLWLIWQRGRFNWSKDAYDSSFNNVLLILMNGMLVPVGVVLMEWGHDAYGWLSIPSLDKSIWDGVSPWLSIPLVLLAIDFADYWVHRLMHVSKWAWPIHAVHHSDPHPTALTVGRVHLLEAVLMQMTYLLLLAWLSLPYEVLGGVAGLRVLHNMYIHIDVDWDHGPLKYLIASPRYHRWHHADEPKAYGKNLANLFPFYDVLFGTYYMPGTCRIAPGAQGVPTRALEMVAWPLLAWARLLQPRRARQNETGVSAGSEDSPEPGEGNGTVRPIVSGVA